MPLVASSAVQAFRAKNRSRLYLHYRRFALDAADAVDWYESAMLGQLRLPEAGEDTALGKDVSLLGVPFVCEPAWPDLEASNKLDFAPDWARQSRAHFLYAKECLPATVLDVVRQCKNRDRLEQWLHFDLVDLYNDYLGAICLVAPNPLFRSIEKSHLDKPNDGAAETIAYKLVARAGQCLDGMRLEIVNEYLRGRMTPVATEFDGTAIRELDFPAPVNKEGRIVTHPSYGLLQWNCPVSLIRTVQFRLSVESGRKRVGVPEGGKKRPSYSYCVSEREDAGVSLVGTTLNDEDVEARNITAEQRRAHSQRRQGQHWFKPGEGKQATRFIRKKIGEAQNGVLIADPYFAGRAMLAFGHAVQRSGIHLRVLTSKKALESESAKKGTISVWLESTCNTLTRLVPNFKVRQRPKKITIERAIETFKNYPTQPEIRVLPGRTPALHDRFLVVDDDVWLSGNSFETLGERAGMVLRLPAPEAVVKHLEKLWDCASPLPGTAQPD